MFVNGQAREMGAGHLRRRVAHLLGQAVDGFGHRLHGRRVFVGVHLRESITAGTRSALTLDRLQGAFVFSHVGAADSRASHTRHSLQSLSLLIRDHQSEGRV